MRGKQNRVVTTQILDKFPHLPNLIGIQTDRWLIENEELRFMDHRVGQTEPLAEALRQRRNHLALDLGQAAEIRDIRQPLLDSPARNAFESRAKGQILIHPHVVRQRDVLRHVTDMLPRPQ